MPLCYCFDYSPKCKKLNQFVNYITNIYKGYSSNQLLPLSSSDEGTFVKLYNNGNFTIRNSTMSGNLKSRARWISALKVTCQKRNSLFFEELHLINHVESLVSKQVTNRHSERGKLRKKMIGKYNPLSAFAWWKQVLQSFSGSA